MFDPDLYDFEFTVKRGEWHTCDNIESNYGFSEVAESCLYNNKTKTSCCLGFLSRKVGLKNKQLKDIPDLNYLLRYSGEFPSRTDLINSKIGIKFKKVLHCRDINNKYIQKIMKINDSCLISAKEREDKLTKLFAKRRIKINFTGKYLNKKIKASY